MKCVGLLGNTEIDWKQPFAADHATLTGANTIGFACSKGKVIAKGRLGRLNLCLVGYGAHGRIHVGSCAALHI